jgi:hypothetical protein
MEHGGTGNKRYNQFCRFLHQYVQTSGQQVVQLPTDPAAIQGRGTQLKKNENQCETPSCWLRFRNRTQVEEEEIPKI